jgi:hypothetical protein
MMCLPPCRCRPSASADGRTESRAKWRVASYWKAAEGGLLDGFILMSSLLLGAVLMAMPIVLLNLKGRPYFRQDRD